MENNVQQRNEDHVQQRNQLVAGGLFFSALYLLRKYAEYEIWKKGQEDLSGFQNKIMAVLVLTEEEYELYKGKKVLLTVRRDVRWWKNKTIVEFKCEDGLTRTHHIKEVRYLQYYKSRDYFPDKNFKEFTGAAILDFREFDGQYYTQVKGVLANNDGIKVPFCAINVYHR